jgi:hypothetical protein
MKIKLSILLFIFIIMSLVKLTLAEDHEKTILLNSKFFGDLTKATKIKKSGRIELQPWDSYVKYSETIPDNSLKQILLMNIRKLNIDYDEIWIKEMDDSDTAAEKIKYKGQQNIVKIYWLKNKVQAETLERYYISDPVTKKKIGKHKITSVRDRDSVLKEVAK